MTKELVENKLELSQKELQGRIAEYQAMQQRAETLSGTIHNLKVQIATYNDLLSDDTAEASEAVKETIEELVAG